MVSTPMPRSDSLLPTINVGELIALLQKLPPDAKVYTYEADFNTDTVSYLHLTSVSDGGELFFGLSNDDYVVHGGLFELFNERDHFEGEQ